jgi:hypothetical protein
VLDLHSNGIGPETRVEVDELLAARRATGRRGAGA